MGNLLAGAAMRKITPTMKQIEAINKCQDQRYGRNENFDGIHEDIYIRVIALSNGKTKVVLAGADLGQFPMAQLICDRLVAECGIDPMGFIVSGTHNHECYKPHVKQGDDPWIFDSPASDALEEYSVWIQDQAVDAVKEALAKLEPARMGVNRGMSYINACRDMPTPIGGIQANNFHGPSDHELIVLRFDSLTTNKTLGMFVNHATHSNAMVWNLYNGTYAKIGADLGGGISRFVEKANKNRFPVIWAKGAAGDQNPIVRSSWRIFDVNDDGEFSMEQVTFTPRTSLLQLKSLVATQGLEILQLNDEMNEFSEDFQFAGAETFRRIPGRKSYNELKIHPLCGERPEPVPYEKPIDFRFRLAVLNGIAFATANCEAYTRMGMMVKQLMPNKYTVFIALSYGMMGYIPDAETEKINVMGTMSSHAWSGAESEAAFLDGFKELKSKLGL